MREEVLHCIKDACPEIDFLVDKKLIDDGVLDSLSIIQIIMSLSETFGIAIDADDITTDYFNSVDGLYQLVLDKKASA